MGLPGEQCFLWTPAAERELVRLWRSGLCARRIGDLVGCGKNAAVGKIHRMQKRDKSIRGRPSPIKLQIADGTYVRYVKHLKRPNVVKREQRTRHKIVTSTNPERRPPGGTFKTCQWPLWSDDLPIGEIRRRARAGELKHCAAPTIECSSYCGQHAAKASGGKPAGYEL